MGGSIASLFPGLDVFRLIDVWNECIFETRDLVPPYLALSYVWGTVSNIRLTKANRLKALRPGALSVYEVDLPATIRDAMTLFRGLDWKYLWVDSLCLLQNDPEDLECGVGVIDYIYEKAWLTVIAACGYDANAGLPGIKPGSRAEQPLARKVYPGIFIGAYISLEHLLLTSVNNTRAWTYDFFF